ncbi:MAG: DUF4190 domain-containing protein [Phycisphaerales bacterium]
MSDAAKYKVRLANSREFGPADMELLVQWAREGRIPNDAMLVPDDGREPYPAVDEPSLNPHILAPPTRSTGPIERHEQEGPALIPYKNPAALVGYYLSIFSCIPLLGLILGPTAIVLGIVGLRRVAKHPQRKGTVHAWIAILFGLLGTAIGVSFIVLYAIGFF